MSVNPTMSPVAARNAISVNTFDFKGTFRDFYNEMNYLLRAYSDPKKDIIIGGTFIPAEQKNSASATLLFNAEINKREQMQETLFASWTAMYQLEKSLGSGA
jgi:hypothetical protein